MRLCALRQSSHGDKTKRFPRLEVRGLLTLKKFKQDRGVKLNESRGERGGDEEEI